MPPSRWTPRGTPRSRCAFFSTALMARKQRGCSKAVESRSTASNTCGAPGTFASHRSFRTTNANITRASLRLREQHAQQLADLHSFLLHRVALAQRDRFEQSRIFFTERLE